MKYLGLISILISSIYIGIHLHSGLKKRVETLEQIIGMIDFIETELSYINSDIFTLLELLSNHKGFNHLRFINDCISHISEGNDFDEAWQKSLNCFSSPLLKNDIKILQSFGSMLGKSDLQGQINNCRIHRERTVNQLNEANRKLAKYGNLSIRLPVLCGILLIIILV